MTATTTYQVRTKSVPSPSEHAEMSLPKHWKIKKLGEVCVTTSGGTPNRGNSKFYQGNIPWVKSGELDKGLILDTEEKISEEAIKNSSAKIFPKGTLLIALYGATIGKLAFLGIDAATNQAICGIFKNDNIESKYLYHFLFYKKPSLVKQGIGGAQPNINQGILKNLDLPLPPLPEQQAIVAKIEALLSELDNGKQQLLTAQQQLKVYRQSLLKWAFDGKLTNKDVKEGELPEGWKWVKLKELINKIRCGSGIVPSNEKSNYPILRSSSVRAGKINFNDIKYVHKIEKIKKDDFIIKGDLLFTRLNGSIDYVGNCAMVSHIFPNNLIYPDRLFRMQLLKPKYGDYIVHFFSTSFARRIIERNAKSTAGHMRISTPDITEMLVPLCPDKEQQLIVDKLESKLTVCDKIEETISQSLLQAETLRQSVLKKAFEGRLV